MGGRLWWRGEERGEALGGDGTSLKCWELQIGERRMGRTEQGFLRLLWVILWHMRGGESLVFCLIWVASAGSNSLCVIGRI